MLRLSSHVCFFVYLASKARGMCKFANTLDQLFYNKSTRQPELWFQIQFHPPSARLKPNNCRTNCETCRITWQEYLQNKNRKQIESQQCNKYTQMPVIKTTLKCLLEERVVQSNSEVSNERARRFRGHYKIIFYRHSWQARVEQAACNKLGLWNDAARHINHDDEIYSFLAGSFHVISCPLPAPGWTLTTSRCRIRFIGHLRRHGHTANHCGLITNVNCKTVSSWLPKLRRRMLQVCVSAKTSAIWWKLEEASRIWKYKKKLSGESF